MNELISEKCQRPDGKSWQRMHSVKTGQEEDTGQYRDESREKILY